MVAIVDDADRLRRFSRFFTQRVGVLTDRYLGQPRPLAEARLLFEIGADGADVRRRLLGELERQAGARGHRAVRLDTHEVLTEAIALYRTSGYDEVAPYDDNPHAHHGFHKRLPGPAPEPPS